MDKTRVSSERLIVEMPIKGIFVDGRKDPTLILIKDSIEDSITKTFCRRIEKEENISVASEPDRSYLTHYTPSKGADKPAKEAAIELYNWMLPRGIAKLNMQYDKKRFTKSNKFSYGSTLLSSPHPIL